MNKLTATLGLCLLAGLPSMATTVTWMNNTPSSVTVTFRGGRGTGTVTVTKSGKTSPVKFIIGTAIYVLGKGESMDITNDAPVDRLFNVSLDATNLTFNASFKASGDSAEVAITEFTSGSQTVADAWVRNSGGNLTFSKP